MGELIATLVPKVFDFISDKFKTEEEKEEARKKLEMLIKQQIEDYYDKEQRELTKRMSLDMTSDSWLSKNIRPMTLIYLMALFTLAFFRDVPQQTLNLLQNLLLTVFVFYFGSRTLEKVTLILKGKK